MKYLLILPLLIISALAKKYSSVQLNTDAKQKQLLFPQFLFGGDSNTTASAVETPTPVVDAKNATEAALSKNATELEMTVIPGEAIQIHTKEAMNLSINIGDSAQPACKGSKCPSSKSPSTRFRPSSAPFTFNGRTLNNEKPATVHKVPKGALSSAKQSVLESLTGPVPALLIKNPQDVMPKTPRNNTVEVPRGVCASRKTCQDCSKHDGCSWCASAQLQHSHSPCLASSGADGSCANWIDDVSWCPIPCEDMSSCNDCLAVPSCGWCGGLQKCLAGNRNGSLTGKCQDFWVWGSELEKIDARCANSDPVATMLTFPEAEEREDDATAHTHEKKVKSAEKGAQKGVEKKLKKIKGSKEKKTAVDKIEEEAQEETTAKPKVKKSQKLIEQMREKNMKYTPVGSKTYGVAGNS
eukprot:Platyproteum_vivax@DN5814_c0_g1_i1.p1